MSYNTDYLISILEKRWEVNFIEKISRFILDNQAIEDIYSIATEKMELSTDKSKKNKIIFRAAYCLDTLYFADRDIFEPFIEIFWDDFSRIKSESVKRHFARIMYDLLKYRTPTQKQLETIVETCIIWITEQKVKPAVQIWAMEILIKLRNKIEWIDEIIPELFDTLCRSDMPSINVRLKQWRKKL